MDKTQKRSRSHIVYKTDKGQRVPGVTTILGIKAKPAVVRWQVKLALQGIDPAKHVDNLANIGTLAHYLVECELGKTEPTTERISEYNIQEMDRAENALLSFWEWEKNHEIESILLEAPLVSEQHFYGGTADFYGKVDGVLSLIDIKTSKALYPEHITQTAAYKELLEENGHEVERVSILRVGREPTEGFEERIVSADELDLHWRMFDHLLWIYKLDKMIEKGGA